MPAEPTGEPATRRPFTDLLSEMMLKVGPGAALTIAIYRPHQLSPTMCNISTAIGVAWVVVQISIWWKNKPLRPERAR